MGDPLVRLVVFVSACPGACNAPWRKAEAYKSETGIPHDLEPVPGDPVWCAGCARGIVSSLRSLPWDACLVLVEMQYGTAASRERVGGTRDRPLHLKEGLARLIEEFYGVLIDWEDDIREHRSFSPRKPRRQGVQIEQSSKFLLGQLGWLMSKHPYPEATRAFGWEITSLHRKALKATHQTDVTPERCVGVRCPGCSWKALVREVIDHQSTGYVLCQNCSRLLDPDGYRAAVTASLLKEGLR